MICFREFTHSLVRKKGIVLGDLEYSLCCLYMLICVALRTILCMLYFQDNDFPFPYLELAHFTFRVFMFHILHANIMDNYSTIVFTIHPGQQKSFIFSTE